MGAACSSDQNQKPVTPYNVDEVKPEEPDNALPVTSYGNNNENNAYGGNDDNNAYGDDQKPAYGDNQPAYGDNKPAPYGDDVQPVAQDYGPAEAAGSVMDYEAYNKWIGGYDHTSANVPASAYRGDDYAQNYTPQADYGYQSYDSQPVGDYSNQYSNQEYYY